MQESLFLDDGVFTEVGEKTAGKGKMRKDLKLWEVSSS